MHSFYLFKKKKVCRETTCAVRRRRPHAAHACCVSRSRRFSCARFHLALLRAVPRCTVRCLNAAGHAARPRRVAGCVTEVSVRALRDVRTAAASHDAALLRTYPPPPRRQAEHGCVLSHVTAGRSQHSLRDATVQGQLAAGPLFDSALCTSSLG